MARIAALFATMFAAATQIHRVGAQQVSTPTLSLPFYGYDTQSIVASVVSATPNGATTLKLGCPEPSDADTCGLFPLQTLTVGPSTYHMYMSDAGFTGTQDCNTALAQCTESAGGISANFPGMSTTKYSGTEIATLPVTVTSGAEKLNGMASATASATPGSSESSSTGAKTSEGGSTQSATTSNPTQATGAAAASAEVANEAIGIFALLAGIVGYAL